MAFALSFFIAFFIEKSAGCCLAVVWNSFAVFSGSSASVPLLYAVLPAVSIECSLAGGCVSCCLSGGVSGCSVNACMWLLFGVFVL